MIESPLSPVGTVDTTILQEDLAKLKQGPGNLYNCTTARTRELADNHQSIRHTSDDRMTYFVLGVVGLLGLTFVNAARGIAGRFTDRPWIAISGRRSLAYMAASISAIPLTIWTTSVVRERSDHNVSEAGRAVYSELATKYRELAAIETIDAQQANDVTHILQSKQIGLTNPQATALAAILTGN